MEKSFLKSAILTAVIVGTFILGYEFYLRTQGIKPDYDNSPALWANARAKVYELKSKAVVFIGSSRIKYDLDIPTWQNATGTQAIQLAIEGSTPRTVLTDLANDEKFKGRLVVDVTERIFFSSIPFFFGKPEKDIKYFHQHTPAQQAGFYINNVLESQLAILDQENLSLNAQLDALQISSRKGVFMMPIFPADFGRNTFNRQSFMANSFLIDTAKQNQVKNIWGFMSKVMQGPPITDAQLNTIMELVKKDVAKITARGGEVLFVRTPCSGLALGELKSFPREKFWDKLLSVTNCKGVFFLDYPAIDHFICPEFSHLDLSGAKIYTENLVEILANEKGWKFNEPIITVSETK